MEGGAFCSVSEKRALHLNKKSLKKQKDDVDLSRKELLERLHKQYGDQFEQVRNSSMGTLWREFVKNKADAIAFMEVMYPQFQKPIQLAYVDMFERAIKGEIKLPEDYMVTDEKRKKKKETTWDPIKDLEEERTKGLINVSMKRLDELEMEEIQKKKE